MSRDIAEKDWKAFRPLHELALDRAFERALSDVQRMLGEKDKPPRDRYWNIQEFLKENRKQLANTFDGLSRSSAVLQLLHIRALGLLSGEEMSRFSPELREQIESWLNMAAKRKEAQQGELEP
jgi:hypothetical protein